MSLGDQFLDRTRSAESVTQGRFQCFSIRATSSAR